VRESLGMKTQRRNESEDSIANLRRDTVAVWWLPKGRCHSLVASPGRLYL
jgi:hypothetical protein